MSEAKPPEWSVQEWREIVERQANSATFYVCFEDCMEMLAAYEQLAKDHAELKNYFHTDLDVSLKTVIKERDEWKQHHSDTLAELDRGHEDMKRQRDEARAAQHEWAKTAATSEMKLIAERAKADSLMAEVKLLREMPVISKRLVDEQLRSHSLLAESYRAMLLKHGIEPE